MRSKSINWQLAIKEDVRKSHEQVWIIIIFLLKSCLICSPFGNQVDRNVGRSARFTFHSEMTMLRYPALNLAPHMDLFLSSFFF